MFSVYTMTLNTRGIREGSKEYRPEGVKVKEREKEKEQAEEEEDTSSDQEDPKAEEKVHEPSAFQDATSQKFLQIAVKQVVENEEEALVTSDYWQVDELRRELCRHHQERRMNLHEMQRAETTPIPKDQILDERETHIEYPQSGKKVLHKDNWRDKRNSSRRRDELWKGQTIYKTKEGLCDP